MKQEHPRKVVCSVCGMNYEAEIYLHSAEDSGYYPVNCPVCRYNEGMLEYIISGAMDYLEIYEKMNNSPISAHHTSVFSNNSIEIINKIIHDLKQGHPAFQNPPVDYLPETPFPQKGGVMTHLANILIDKIIIIRKKNGTILDTKDAESELHKWLMKEMKEQYASAKKQREGA